MGQDAESAIWLVKSGEKVTGPFSTSEVIEKLRSREVVVIDEVIAPLGRWRYIRDETVFRGVVDEIRKGLMSAREDTEAQGSTQITHVSQSTPTPIFPERSMTATPIGMDHGSMDKTNFQEAEFTEEPTPGRGRPIVAEQLRQYGYGREKTIQAKASRFSSLSWIAATVAIVLTGWFFFSGKNRSEESIEASGNSLNFGSMINEAERYWRIGEFELALDFFNRANVASPNQPEVIVKLAPLMIQIEQQTVAAKRLALDTIKENGSTMATNMKSEMNLVLGLAALHSDDFDEAESLFKTALTVSPLSFTAGFNSGMTLFVRRSYSDASRKFLSLGDDPASLIMVARSLIEANDNDKKVSNDAEKSIQRILDRHADYRLEAFVIGSYLDVMRGDSRGAASRVISALESDPDQTNDHWHDPILFTKPLQWPSLVSMCQKVGDVLASAASKALHALCLGKAGDREQAFKVIEQELATKPDDPYLNAVNVYLLMSFGREEEAKAAINMSNQADRSVMKQILQARLCQRQLDLSCAEKIWDELLNIKPQLLTSHTSLARIRFSQGQNQEALGLVERAQSISPRYLPAMRLREEFKAQ